MMISFLFEFLSILSRILFVFLRRNRNMKKGIFKVLFYILVVSVYGVFFSVQSFFNFEGQSNARNIVKDASFVHFSQNHEHPIKITPLQTPSKHNVRLNKRYHQSDIAPCPLITAAGPVLFVIPRVLGNHRIIPLPSIAVSYSRLRGPPGVV
ncbi:MAG TPA: hypothetical protein VK518_16990 [Puia sp.]|nr:hypothetical protein [Puia sp.]